MSVHAQADPSTADARAVSATDEVTRKCGLAGCQPGLADDDAGMNKLTTAGLCALALMFGSCGEDPAEGGAKNADANATAASMLQSDAAYGDFWKLVELAGLADRLAASEKITVFAPTKKAFDRADGVLIAASESQETAAAFVNGYLVAGAHKIGDLEAGVLATLGAKTLEVEIEDHGDHSHAHVAGNHIDYADKVVGNGVVHGMNSLFP